MLIGNAASNRFWGNVKDSIPVKIDADKITILNKSYSGRHLGLAMIYPNPLNPDKYICLVSGNNLQTLDFDWKSLWFDFNSDYVVWQNIQRRKPKLVDRGLFDRTWNLD